MSGHAADVNRVPGGHRVHCPDCRFTLATGAGPEVAREIAVAHAGDPASWIGAAP